MNSIMGFQMSAAMDEEEKLVCELASRIIMDAVTENSSDIHIEPLRAETVIKYRVDGPLREISRHSPAVGNSIIRVIKKMSALNPDLTDLPQDGRIRITTDKIDGTERRYNFMVTTLPTFYGEKMVLRIIDPNSIDMIIKNGLEHICLEGENLAMFEQILGKPYGLILFNGPSGSGKTTTAYVSLGHLVKRTKGIASIFSVEDPVECLIDGITQVPINLKRDFTFPRALKSVLRQDPDIIFCGEVRDTDTALLLVEAAHTGHLVLSQFHTSDVAHTLKLLVELGIEPYLAGMVVEGIISQRLTRRICPHCREEVHNSPEFLEQFKNEFDIERLRVTYKGTGCDKCQRSGFRGRAPIYQIFTGGDWVADMLSKNPSLAEIRDELKRRGFKTLRQNALEVAASGKTTLEEALRCTKI